MGHKLAIGLELDTVRGVSTSREVTEKKTHVHKLDFELFPF